MSTQPALPIKVAFKAGVLEQACTSTLQLQRMHETGNSGVREESSNTSGQHGLDVAAAVL